jgi:hypothetical protein
MVVVMSTQPEALRLADELNAVSETGADPDVIQESATELRRLHSVNAELLDALNALVAAHGSILDLRESDELKLARLAIAKATGETK